MQATIKKSFSIEGIGVHTGTKAKVTILPAEPDSGIKFRFAETCKRNGINIPDMSATVENVKGTLHGTTLSNGKQEVKTCEHLLSALYGLGVDNAIIEIKGTEIPALDGSSLPITKLIEVSPQNSKSKAIELKECVFVKSNDASIFIAPSEEFKITFIIDYPYPGINTQYKCFPITPEIYREQIAGARTYAFTEWIDELQEKGLIRGGSLKNSVVIGPDGPLNPLRYEDEQVRHKILDLIGDLSLLGTRLNGWVFAVKAGHTLNIELVRRIKCSLE